MVGHIRKSLTVLAILAMVSLPGCKKSSSDPEPEPTEQEKVTAILTGGTGTWAPSLTSGVSIAGIDVTEEFFSGFTIQFTATQIFTTGTTPVWLRTDTWQFMVGSSTTIIRGQDGGEVEIESITETELKISLDWDQTTYADGGKVKSLPGRYTFVVNK